MKKVLSIAAVAALAVSFTACKKNYTCECTTYEDGVPMATTPNTIRDTKKKAQEQCEAQNTTVGSLKTECTLK
ncbi:MAG: hypothetical protein D6707_00845 [Bacteroidetes bacterium]|nr:MAG: hypothetical protein D6707_00845 [Bacteroidota bacterium]